MRLPLAPPPEGAPTLLRRLCGRNTRLANRYRDGRVFIAGDTLLDSYETERHAAPTGWFVPPLNLTTDDGHTRRLAELLRDARPLLLDLTGGNNLAATAEPWNDRMHRVTATADDAPAPAFLIRTEDAASAEKDAQVASGEP